MNMPSEIAIIVGALITSVSAAVLCLQARNERLRQERMYAEFMERRNENARKLEEKLRAGAAKATSSVRTLEVRGQEAVARLNQKRSATRSDDLLDPFNVGSPLNPIHSDDILSSRSPSIFNNCFGSSSYDSGSSSSCSSSSCD